jgi:hypothetical protein
MRSVRHTRAQLIIIDTKTKTRLTTETVEGAALSLEGIDNVERGDGLALGVLCVRDGITDNTLEEGLEDTAGLFVDHWVLGLACDSVGSFDGTTYWLRYA